MVEVTIQPMEAGKKMHRLLRQMLPGMPLSGIHKMIRTGRVKRNGKKAKSEDIVQAGDVVRLYMAEEDFEQVRKPVKKFAGVSGDVDVLYEDHHILVVNKQSGLLVHGAEGEHKDTLVNRVLAYLYRQGEEFGMFTPAPVHRLDRNTSGIVLFAKDGDTSRALSDAIATHDVGKWYVTIVNGTVPSRGTIDAPLERNRRENMTTISESGKQSITKYERIAAANDVSMVRVELISGRTHQIRAHFAHIRHPLWGDPKYSRTQDATPVSYQLLHAGWLKLPDGRVFCAPVPGEFRAVARKLGFSDKVMDDVVSWRP